MMETSDRFSFLERQAVLSRLSDQVYDVTVFGGGITGVSTARSLARQGLKVLLLEQGDFASGTSSKSSKLIHGGLRYLENFEFGLVFEALQERATLLKELPHLVKPLRFYIPVYQRQGRSMFELSMGLWLYDSLSLFRSGELHERLDQKQLLQQIPFLKPDDLKGGFIYSDAYMRDDLMTVEVAREASQLGVDCVTRAQVLNRQELRDLESGTLYSFKTRSVISCLGAWTDLYLNQKRKLLKPSQGVHLIFERSRFPVPAALLLMKGQRILFVIPREDLGAGVVIVGTTDAPSPENPGLVQVTNAERTYLLECLEEYFPELKLTAEDIISEYVGVRPLFSGESKEGELSTVSREHHIEEGPEGMTVVVGGKYTTHRRMAEEIVQFHLKRHEFVEHPDFKNTQREPIDWIQENIKKTTEIQKLDQEFRSRLESLLGSELKLKPLEGFENLLGHLIFAIRFEAVLHVEDFVLRRVPLYLARRDHGREWFKVLCQALLLEKTAKIDGWEEELKRLNLVLNSLSSPAVTVIESKQATFDS